MFVFPVVRGAELPPEFREFAVVPPRPARAPAGGDRGEPRPLGEGVDEGRAALSATAWRTLAYGLPLAFLALFFAFPLAAILERGLRSEGASGSAARRPHRPGHRATSSGSPLWQAVASTALTLVVALPAAYVLGRYAFRGRGRRAGARHRPVRPPHRRRRAGVSRGASGRARARPARDPRRARVLQRRGRRPDRGDVLGRPRPARLRSRGDARRRPVAELPRGDAAAARARARRGGGARLPLHVHLVRHRPDPRRAELRDDRDRDLQPGGAALRPARRGRARARPAGLRGRRRAGRDPARGEAGGRRAGAAGGGRPPPAARVGARRRSSRGVSAGSRSSSGFRSPCSSSARSQSGTDTGSTRTARSPSRPERSSRRPGRRS